MSKLAVYLSILATVLVGFHLFGLVENTTLLGLIINPERFFEFEFYTQTLLVIAGVATAGIAATLFVQGKSDLAIAVLITPLLLSLGQDILVVYNQLAGVLPDFALIMIAPLTIIYALTVIEWLRGVSQ